jgi:hypothetical protein
MIRYSKDAYEKQIFQLNIRKNKKLLFFLPFLGFVITLVIGLIAKEDLFFCLPLGIIVAVAVKYYFKKYIIENAKKFNYIKDIKYIEQWIDNKGIVEKVVRIDGIEEVNEYLWKDVVKVSEDKWNYYLYLEIGAAIIVDKRVEENKQQLQKILKANNLIK